MLRKIFGMLVAVSFLGLPMIGHAIEFTDKQKTDHPCLTGVSLPSNVTLAKAETVPEKYRGWIGSSGALVGQWVRTRAGDVCQVILIEGINDRGLTPVWYIARAPGKYDDMLRSLATITETIPGQQVLEISLYSGRTTVTYILKDGEKRVESRHSSGAKGYAKVLD